jgi:hypothetical protein
MQGPVMIARDAGKKTFPERMLHNQRRQHIQWCDQPYVPSSPAVSIPVAWGEGSSLILLEPGF